MEKDHDTQQAGQEAGSGGQRPWATHLPLWSAGDGLSWRDGDLLNGPRNDQPWNSLWGLLNSTGRATWARKAFNGGLNLDTKFRVRISS